MTQAVFCLTAVLLVACAGATDFGSSTGGAATVVGEPSSAPLRYRLEARESYVAGRTVPIRFTLENVSDDETLWVLRWYTPLEGVAGKIFEVTRAGEPLPYQGPMVKRGDPRREDYARLGPGESASEEVDLAEAWDLAVAGDVRVAFVGRVWDVARDEAALPRARDEHQSMEVPGDPVTFRLVEP